MADADDVGADFVFAVGFGDEEAAAVVVPDEGAARAAAVRRTALDFADPDAACAPHAGGAV